MVLIKGFNPQLGELLMKCLQKAVNHTGHGVFFAIFAERVADNDESNIICLYHGTERFGESGAVKGSDRLCEEPEGIALSHSDVLCSVVDGDHPFFWSQAHRRIFLRLITVLLPCLEALFATIKYSNFLKGTVRSLFAIVFSLMANGFMLESLINNGETIFKPFLPYDCSSWVTGLKNNVFQGRIIMGGLSLLLMTSLMLAGCSVLGKRTASEPPFKVLEQNGDIEVRQYGEMIVAETVIEGAYGQTGAPGFSRLAGYIFGKNRSKEKLSMTAPVLQEQVSEKISMTAPVLQEKRGSAWVMAFVMPEGSTLESLPVPLDPAVKLRSLQGKKVGVIRYSGLHSESNLRNYAGKLTEWLEKKRFRVLSQPRAASYDPPWTLPFLRRNEVHIDIE